MNTHRILSVAALAAGVLAAQAAAETTRLETTQDKVSYAIGMNVGRSLKVGGFEVDPALIARGLADVMQDRTPALTDEEARAILNTYQTELRQRADEARREAAKANREAGAAFLAANAGKGGVKVQEVALPDGAKSAFQYRVLRAGTGEKPQDNHQVTVHYRGTLIDGAEFDSSHSRNQPATFGVTGVIRGWTEALKLMPVGSKWQLFIPSELAYGDQPRGPQIPPGSTLIFEVELLATQGPEPIVSDIIKVPSADEMRRGAQIETIRAGEVEKLRQTAPGGN